MVLAALKTIVVAAVAITVAASLTAKTARADGNSAFGAKPWLSSPRSAQPTPPQAQRAHVYRSKLQREIRRLELKRPLSGMRSKDRLKTFRRELSRIERATGSRRRR